MSDKKTIMELLQDLADIVKDDYNPRAYASVMLAITELDQARKDIDDRDKTIKKLQKILEDNCRLSFDSGYYCGKLLAKLSVAKAELEATEDYINSLLGNHTFRIACIRHTLKKIDEEITPQNNPIKKDEKETEKQSHKTKDKGDIPT